MRWPVDLSFLVMQIGRMEWLFSSSTQTEANWSAQTPAADRPAANKLKIAPFLPLMDQDNLGGRR